jgi:uncharacterized membrane protein
LAEMNRTVARRLMWLLVGVAVLAGVGFVAYNVGLAADHGTARSMFGPMRGYYGGLGAGFGPFGMLGALLIGLLLVWLVVSVFAGPAAAPHPATNDPTSVDRLRELAELHQSGVLTDEEFAAAKRRLLGL